MNDQLISLGSGIMIGAGTPVILRQEHNWIQFYLFWVGVIIALIGVTI